MGSTSGVILLIRERRRRNNWSVITAVIVHGIWSAQLLFTGAPLRTARLAGFPATNNYIAASVCWLGMFMHTLALLESYWFSRR
jgi:hypothetical protein